MGYDTRLMGSGAQPKPYMGQQQPMQGQLAMPARPGMSTYSTPGAMNAQQGMNPTANLASAMMGRQ